MALKINGDLLDNIPGDANGTAQFGLRSTLKAWKKSGEYTKEKLFAALEKAVVGEPRLAAKLKKKWESKPYLT